MITLNDSIQSIRKRTAAEGLAIDTAMAVAREQERKWETHVNAFVAKTDPMDAGPERGTTENLLAGIPFAVQDTICVKDMPLTCSSRILNGFVPGYDATAVARVRDQGAILLGKLNSSEFGLEAGSSHSIFGATQNPWHPEGGGTAVSGAAAAVASGQIWFSLGADATGELRTDAAECGLSALKPTYPTVSKHGLAASVPSMEQIGIAARHLTDCEDVWNILLGKDEMDSTVTEHPRKDMEKPKDLTRIKVGIPSVYLHAADAKTQNAVQKVAERMRAAGITVQECSVEHLSQSMMAAYVLQCAEASSSLARFDGVRYGYRNQEAKDVLSMYLKTRRDGLSQSTIEKILAGTYFLSVAGYSQYYSQAARLRTLVSLGFSQAFTQFDSLLTPVTAAGANDDALQHYWPACANLAGLPALVFPGDIRDGAPVGVQLIGKAYTEPLLFSLATAAKMEIDWNQALPNAQCSGGDRV
jgi:aspartyl-tRNA(Asn)/glutamyl-tRNA(Gln) amidotransferase subunit A